MEIVKIFDLSVPLKSGMPAWPTQKEIKIDPVGSVLNDGSTSEFIAVPSHTGTHIDAPAHFIHEATTVDEIPLDRLIGPGYCIRPKFSGTDIHREDFEKVWSSEYDNSIILINTGWDRKRSFTREFQYEFPGLAVDAIPFFREHNVRIIGIDTLGIEPYSHSDFKVHRELLGSGIPFIEDLAGLHQLEEGKQYLIAALPLKIHRGSGCMARVVALDIGGNNHAEGI